MSASASLWQRRAKVLTYGSFKTCMKLLTFFFWFWSTIYLSILYFTKCDLRVKVLIQKSILVFCAIRRIEMLTLGSSNYIKNDEKAALMKLEVYLDALIDHIGIRKVRNFILDWCKETNINNKRFVIYYGSEKNSTNN